MRKLEWFVNFQFDDIDILIEKKDIAGSGYSGDIQFLFDIVADNGKIIVLDDFMKDNFGIECGGKIDTVLRLNSEFPLFLVSSIVPKIEGLCYKSFSTFGGIMGKKLFYCGFKAFHFSRNKMQCLLDFNKIANI